MKSSGPQRDEPVHRDDGSAVGSRV
jgi:hypothetical protein